ncbi:tyrosinase family protein, partial [Skermanella aerolata]|uniref:tyrosinase family protein n=1 Tax=Skermanella aerolata TaxID=393310 RepID=UPI003D1F4717
MGIRKNQASLTLSERAAFVAAVRALKANGAYDTFVAQHRAAFLAGRNDPAHNGPGFLPWHREYLLRFERALQSIDPSVSLPYWDWTVDNLPASSLWDSSFMGGNGSGSDERVTTGPFAHATGQWTLTVLDPGETDPFLKRSLGGMGRLPTQTEVDSALVVPYDQAPWHFQSGVGGGSFRAGLEGGIHNPGHMWVGGSMMAMSSPNDPVFWLHHCNIDRLWVDWQLKYESEPYLPASGTPNVVSGHALDDPMPPWHLEPASPTPRSVLDHHALGYAYDTEGGRVMVADFSQGPPVRGLYWENWGQFAELDGWHDAGDLQLVGDFMGTGRDQVLFINRDPGQSGGRVMVADFSQGPPVRGLYWENWGQFAELDGWHDAGDLQLVGDFMGTG